MRIHNTANMFKLSILRLNVKQYMFCVKKFNANTIWLINF